MTMTFLLWVGGPHDGLHNAEPDLDLAVGDAVRCACHDIPYEAKYFDGNGIWHVEFDPKRDRREARVVGAER